MEHFSYSYRMVETRICSIEKGKKWQMPSLNLLEQPANTMLHTDCLHVGYMQQ